MPKPGAGGTSRCNPRHLDVTAAAEDVFEQQRQGLPAIRLAVLLAAAAEDGGMGEGYDSPVVW